LFKQEKTRTVVGGWKATFFSCKLLVSCNSEVIGEFCEFE